MAPKAIFLVLNFNSKSFIVIQIETKYGEFLRKTEKNRLFAVFQTIRKQIENGARSKPCIHNFV